MLKITYLFDDMNYLLYNIIILSYYFQHNYMAFQYLGKSRWEDKVTATKVRATKIAHEDPPASREGIREWSNDDNFHCHFVCVTMVICYN